MDPDADKERELIDDEISRKEVEILLLRRRRNALAPVSCLPEELLVHIFTLCRDSYGLGESEGDPRSDLCHSLSWLSVAEVCAEWRHIALSQTQLWTRVIVRGKHYPHENALVHMLARSEGAPLVVELIDLENPHIMRILLQELYRIEALYLTDCGETALYNCRPQFQKPAPLLQTLSIEGTADGMQLLPLSYNGFMAGSAPLLRCVSLAPLPAQWYRNLPNRHYVQDLHMGCHIFQPAFLFAALDDMPNLQVLSIHVTEYEQDSHMFSRDANVTLEHLQELTLMCAAQTAAVIIRNLHSVSLQVMELELDDIDSCNFRARNMLVDSIVDLKRSSDPPLFILETLRVEYWTLSATGDGDARLSIRANGASGRKTRSWLGLVVPNLLDAFPLSLIRSIAFVDIDLSTGTTTPANDGWNLVSQKLTALQIIRLEACNESTAPLMDIDIGEHVLYPALREVVVDGHNTKLLAICDWLYGRQQRGFNLDRLQVRGAPHRGENVMGCAEIVEIIA